MCPDDTVVASSVSSSVAVYTPPPPPPPPLPPPLAATFFDSIKKVSWLPDSKGNPRLQVYDVNLNQFLNVPTPVQAHQYPVNINEIFPVFAGQTKLIIENHQSGLYYGDPNAFENFKNASFMVAPPPPNTDFTGIDFSQGDTNNNVGSNHPDNEISTVNFNLRFRFRLPTIILPRKGIIRADGSNALWLSAGLRLLLSMKDIVQFIWINSAPPNDMTAIRNSMNNTERRKLLSVMTALRSIIVNFIASTDFIIQDFLVNNLRAHYVMADLPGKSGQIFNVASNVTYCNPTLFVGTFLWYFNGYVKRRMNAGTALNNPPLRNEPHYILNYQYLVDDQMAVIKYYWFDQNIENKGSSFDRDAFGSITPTIYETPLDNLLDAFTPGPRGCNNVLDAFKHQFKPLIDLVTGSKPGTMKLGPGGILNPGGTGADENVHHWKISSIARLPHWLFYYASTAMIDLDQPLPPQFQKMMDNIQLFIRIKPSSKNQFVHYFLKAIVCTYGPFNNNNFSTIVFHDCNNTHITYEIWYNNLSRFINIPRGNIGDVNTAGTVFPGAEFNNPLNKFAQAGTMFPYYLFYERYQHKDPAGNKFD